MKEVRIPTKKVGACYVGLSFWWCDYYQVYQVHLVIHRSRRVVNDALLNKKRAASLVDVKSTGDGSLKGLIYAFNCVRTFSEEYPVLVDGDDFQRRRVYTYRFLKEGWKSISLEGRSVVFNSMAIERIAEKILA